MGRFKEVEPSTPTPPLEQPFADDEEICERPASREDRTRYCMRIMTALKWKRGSGPGSTGYALAQAWGMSEDSIQRIAAEASRRIREIVDPSMVRDRLCAALDESIDKAMAKGDLKNLATLARTYSEIMGISGIAARRTIEITGKDGAPLGLPPQLATLTPPPTTEEIEAFIATGKIPVRPVPPSH